VAQATQQTVQQVQARVQAQVQAGSLYNPFHEPVGQAFARQQGNPQVQQPIGAF